MSLYLDRLQFAWWSPRDPLFLAIPRDSHLSSDFVLCSFKNSLFRRLNVWATFSHLRSHSYMPQLERKKAFPTNLLFTQEIVLKQEILTNIQWNKMRKSEVKTFTGCMMRSFRTQNSRINFLSFSIFHFSKMFFSFLSLSALPPCASVKVHIFSEMYIAFVCVPLNSHWMPSLAIPYATIHRSSKPTEPFSGWICSFGKFVFSFSYFALSFFVLFNLDDWERIKIKTILKSCRWLMACLPFCLHTHRKKPKWFLRWKV